MCSNMDGALKCNSTFVVNQESTDATQVGNVLAFLTADLATELDLLQDGYECVLTIVIINLPTGNAFDVEVEIAPIAPVKEASTAIFTTSITRTVFGRLESKGVVWVQAVLYLAGELNA